MAGSQDGQGPNWRPVRVVGRILLVAALAYGGVVLVLSLLQDFMLFPATRTIYRDPGDVGWDFEDMELAVDGETTHGWWIPLDEVRGVCLFSHGNAGNIADRLESISLLREFGLSVLAYDYGGYGRSTGRPSEERLYKDIRAAWDYLVEAQGIGPEAIILFGRSLGAGPTANLATEVDAAGVVLESTFTSVPARAREMFPFLPVNWLVKHRFDNLSKVPRIESPLLIIHSPDDTLIPYHHGRELFEAATEPKTFLKIRGDHNEGFVLSEKTYKAGWEKFLSRVLEGDSSGP